MKVSPTKKHGRPPTNKPIGNLGGFDAQDIKIEENKNDKGGNLMKPIRMKTSSNPSQSSDPSKDTDVPIK